jgi:hypothetical protein
VLAPGQSVQATWHALDRVLCVVHGRMLRGSAVCRLAPEGGEEPGRGLLCNCSMPQVVTAASQYVLILHQPISDLATPGSVQQLLALQLWCGDQGNGPCHHQLKGERYN